MCRVVHSHERTATGAGQSPRTPRTWRDHGDRSLDASGETAGGDTARSERYQECGGKPVRHATRGHGALFGSSPSSRPGSRVFRYGFTPRDGPGMTRPPDRHGSELAITVAVGQGGSSMISEVRIDAIVGDLSSADELLDRARTSSGVAGRSHELSAAALLCNRYAKLANSEKLRQDFVDILGLAEQHGDEVAELLQNRFEDSLAAEIRLLRRVGVPESTLSAVGQRMAGLHADALYGLESVAALQENIQQLADLACGHEQRLEGALAQQPRRKRTEGLFMGLTGVVAILLNAPLAALPGGGPPALVSSSLGSAIVSHGLQLSRSPN
jgi:hypothetical protein